MDKKIIDFINRKGSAYTQKECFELCFDVYFLDYLNDTKCKCNATLGYVNEDCKEPCVSNKRSSFYNKNASNFCSRYCPVECDSMELKVTPSFFEYSSQGNVDLNNTDDDIKDSKIYDNYKDVKENYANFYVYYSDLQYTTISESAKTKLSDLISNVGGTFGLFMGISFLSFLEIFEIIIEIIFIFLTNKVRHK